MVSAGSIRTIIGIIGNMTSFARLLSPLPTFLAIYKQGSVQQYSPVPYIATIFNCALWMVYALPMVQKSNIPLLTVNAAGFVIQLVFLSIFIVFSKKKLRIWVVGVVLAELVSVALLSVLVLTLIQSQKLRLTIIGTICMVASVVMYASPLSVMRMVIKTKSVEYMPISLSLALLLDTVCWVVYGTISNFDLNIVVPDGLGILLAAAQLILYATYYKSSKKKQAEGRNHSSEENNMETVSA